MDPVAFLIEPFAYDFMQRALGMSLLVAAVCGVLSCYLVLKGWSLMGDAIAHAVLPGIVLAYLFAGSRDSIFMLVRWKCCYR